jgi:hypothetical protein
MMRGYQVQHAALRSRSETEHLAPIPVPQPLRMHSYVFDAEDGDGGAVLTGHGRRLPLGRVGCSILQRMAELFVREPAESGCLSADATEEARFIDLTSCAVFQKGKANTSAMEFHSMEYSRPRHHKCCRSFQNRRRGRHDTFLCDGYPTLPCHIPWKDSG